jgi:hydrogenase nickel incorporation protein HypA/HybF
MHELGVMAGVLNLVLDTAEKNEVSAVLKVTMEVGEYSGIIPKLAQDFFHYLAKGTLAERAEVEVRKVPVQVRCQGCGQEMHAEADIFEYGCPHCGSDNLKILSTGRGWRLESIEVE